MHISMALTVQVFNSTSLAFFFFSYVLNLWLLFVLLQLTVAGRIVRKHQDSDVPGLVLQVLHLLTSINPPGSPSASERLPSFSSLLSVIFLFLARAPSERFRQMVVMTRTELVELGTQSGNQTATMKQQQRESRRRVRSRSR